MKTNGKEKRETLSAEAFNGRLVPHIPNEHFKTFRYMGYIHVTLNVKAKKNQLVSTNQPSSNRESETDRE
ncbi:transposase [Metabacillus hrfriensis]|uniref:transposase n=1 Tax=Metabacillus hrfriensis TaxID=3048891 RepID=UPI003C12C231